MIEIVFRKKKIIGDRAHAVKAALEIVRKLGQGECTMMWFLLITGYWLGMK